MNLTLEPKDDRPKNALPGKALSGSELMKDRDTSRSFAKHSSTRFSHQPSYTGRSFLPSRNSPSFFCVARFFAYKRTETRPVHLPSILLSVFLISRHIRESHFSPPENLRPFLELFRFLLTKEQRHVLFICQAFGHPFFSSAVIYGKVISRFQKIFVLFWSYSVFCLQKNRDTSCSFAKHSAIRFSHQPSYTGRSFLASRKSSSFFGVIPLFAYKRTETRPVHLPSIRPSVFFTHAVV